MQAVTNLRTFLGRLHQSWGFFWLCYFLDWWCNDAFSVPNYYHSYTSTRGKPNSLIHQTGQVLVSHPPDPLVDVVEVHQQKLGVPLELLLVLLGLGLEWQERHHRLSVRLPQTHPGALLTLTLSAIMFRKASNTLSATAMTHCIIPEMRRWFPGLGTVTKNYKQPQTHKTGE